MVLAKACWYLLEARDALTLRYVRKVAQSIEYRADGLPDLLRHLSSSVGHGIALIDSAGVLLEAGGHLDPSVHAVIDFTPWVDLARSQGACAAASARVDSPTREGLRIAFFGDGLSEAQLSALAVAAEVAMPAVAARILIDEVAAVNDVSVSSGLLRDFVDLRGTADPEVDRRMLERGWRTTGYHLAFRVIGRARIDAVQLLRFVLGELGTIAADSHATTSGRGVSGWLTFTEPPTPAQTEAHVAALRELHVAARRAFNVATGVGSLQSGSAGLTASLSEAADAARIAVNRSATGWFLRVDGLGLEQLLVAWTGNDTFLPAARSLLAPLQEGRGELLLDAVGLPRPRVGDRRDGGCDGTAPEHGRDPDPASAAAARGGHGRPRGAARAAPGVPRRPCVVWVALRGNTDGELSNDGDHDLVEVVITLDVDPFDLELVPAELQILHQGKLLRAARDCWSTTTSLVVRFIIWSRAGRSGAASSVPEDRQWGADNVGLHG